VNYKRKMRIHRLKECVLKEAGLRGQDVLTLLRLYVGPEEGKTDTATREQIIFQPWTSESQGSPFSALNPIVINQKALSSELGISPAEMSGVVQRCKSLGLLNPDCTVPQQPFFKLLEHGLRFFLPALSGIDVLGVPTAWGNSTVAKVLRGPKNRTPVWAADLGEVHGPAVTPLFRSVPYIVPSRPKLYAALAAVDLLRLSGARETEVALDLLREWSKHFQNGKTVSCLLVEPHWGSIWMRHCTVFCAPLWMLTSWSKWYRFPGSIRLRRN
jgi:hypothetical protein